MTEETNAPAGIGGLNPAAYAEWQVRQKVMEELKASISQALPEDPLQRSIQALRQAADLVGRIADHEEEGWPLSHPVAATLDHLTEALNDLRYGVVEPFLRPRGSGTRLMKASERRLARNAVTLVNCLTGMGVPAGKARARVASELGIAASRIRTWQTPGRNRWLNKLRS